MYGIRFIINLYHDANEFDSLSNAAEKSFWRSVNWMEAGQKGAVIMGQFVDTAQVKAMDFLLDWDCLTGWVV